MSEHIFVLGKVQSSVHENYSILTQNNSLLKATISGKLRHNKIQILENDIVEVRVSPYDLSMGQITRRLSEFEARKMNLQFPSEK